jgi:hypothetical protein
VTLSNESVDDFRRLSASASAEFSRLGASASPEFSRLGDDGSTVAVVDAASPSAAGLAG